MLGNTKTSILIAASLIQGISEDLWYGIPKKQIELKQIKNESPRRGIEPRSPAWQAGILTTILSRIGKIEITCTNQCKIKEISNLLQVSIRLCLSFSKKQNCFWSQLLNFGYHLSITKLNGSSPNFYLNYHQHKSFFHHQIKLFITKFNTFSPNKLIF